MLLEYSIKEPSSNGGIASQCTSAVAAAVSEDLNTEQSLLFNPVMVSTPQHSPTRLRDDVNIHNNGDNVLTESFDIAGVSEQSQCPPDDDDDEMLSFLSPLQDISSTSPINEVMEKSSLAAFKAIKSAVSDRTPRPKRHCTELTTSYAEGDLMRLVRRIYLFPC